MMLEFLEEYIYLAVNCVVLSLERLAQKMAMSMEKCIHDQLLDTNAVNVFRKAIFESALLGTGIIKGPFNFYKRIHKWEKNDEGIRTYNPYEKVVPRIESVSVWDLAPHKMRWQDTSSA